MYKYTQAHRLKAADEFSSVFLFRKVRHGVYFKIHYKPNELPNSRLGLIVSKKIHKRANRRNYMKRVIRELFRQNASNFSGYDIIVRVQKCFNHQDFSVVNTEFFHLTKILINSQSRDSK